MEIRFFAPQAPVYGWKRRVGLCLDKGQGPVIRWRDDFLIIAPSSGAPSGLVAGEPRVRVHVNPWSVGMLGPMTRSRAHTPPPIYASANKTARDKNAYSHFALIIMGDYYGIMPRW